MHIDDLKIFAKSETKIEARIQTMRTFSQKSEWSLDQNLFSAGNKQWKQQNNKRTQISLLRKY